MSNYFDHDASFANDSTNDSGFEDSDSGLLPETGEPTFGGYYNADRTYHYTSDSTDRDPETGAIVRRW